MLILLMFLVLVALICLNVPIAVALAVSGMLGLLATEGLSSLVTVALDMYDGSTKFSLIAIPMFVLAGAIMNAGGITDRLINFISALIGFVRGGLAMVNIGVSLFFAEISGSAVADVAAMGSIMIPQMKKRGYSAPMAAAVTSSSASLAIIIPPSIPMILYATSANTSVEQLFVAGLVPGLLGAAGLMLVAYIFARRYNLPVEEAFNFAHVKATFIEALPTFLLPVIILGGIFGGFVTATEAAGLAVLAALLIGLWYRELDLRYLKRAMLDGGMQTAVVMILVAASVLMGGFLTRAQVPQELASTILSITESKYLILLILNFFFLIIGFFLHFPAFRGRDHPGGADRHPADPTGGHRPGALRPGGHPEPGHRPADAAGRQRTDHGLLDRPRKHLGRDQGEHLLRRRAAHGADDLYLCAVDPDVPG
jgi:tripartite ATP-independent transporter DctM subunit